MFSENNLLINSKTLFKKEVKFDAKSGLVNWKVMDTRSLAIETNLAHRSIFLIQLVLDIDSED